MGSVVESALRCPPNGRWRCAARWCVSRPPAAHACRRLVLADADGQDVGGAGTAARRGLPFVSVLTHPTTGGVSASLGMLGDLNVAEPQALIGFAGPRVIEQTVRETLPEGFQRSEFLVEHGAVDLIIDRRQMRDKLGALLALMMRQPAPVVAES